jgi:hypothetical protein
MSQFGPEHEIAMDVRSLMVAVDDLIKAAADPRLIEHVINERQDIAVTYNRLGFLLSALQGKTLQAAE